MIIYLIPIALAFFIYFTRSLDLEGTIAATFFSYIILLRHNVYWLIILLAFFVVGSIATRFKMSYKKKFTEKRRGIKNVVANGIIAVLMALLGQFYGFIGAIAAATGDTLSSEIGMLSKEKPIMITSFKKTKRGINGGVTLLGLAAAILGGAIIGFSSWVVAPYFQMIWIAIVCGLLGSLFDSVLGALFENDKYMDNFGVNLMATTFGALVATIIFIL